MVSVIILVISEKYGKNCLAGIGKDKNFIRPIKPGGFEDEDIIMDNDNRVDIFDVVDIEFCGPIPIKHHTENMKFKLKQKIKFVKSFNEPEQIAFLTENANDKIMKQMTNRFDLQDEIVGKGKSLALLGPIDTFDIQYNCGNHPRLWVRWKKRF